MNMEHSKLPWQLYAGKLVPEYSHRIIQINDGNGRAICHWMGFDSANQTKPIKKANAAFIVKACNCHDDLVEACKALLKEAVILSENYLQTFSDLPDNATIQGWDKARWQRALVAGQKAKAAIAKAEGK